MPKETTMTRAEQEAKVAKLNKEIRQLKAENGKLKKRLKDVRAHRQQMDEEKNRKPKAKE